VKVILTVDVSNIAPDVMLFTKARMTEILEFLIDGEGPDRAAELQRAPVQTEQTCPTCKARVMRNVMYCDYCEHVEDVAGKSKRSVGG